MGSEGKKLIFSQTKQTREIAGKFAADTVEAQSKEFQSWGLMADWENRYRLVRWGSVCGSRGISQRMGNVIIIVVRLRG